LEHVRWSQAAPAESEQDGDLEDLEDLEEPGVMSKKIGEL
jgi:hypothetical protein